MTPKNVQDYLDKGMYGAHKIKPDEQKKYLGTFRERVIFIVLLKEAETNRYDDFCINQLTAYPKGTLLISANSPSSVQNRYIKLAQKTNIQFRLVDANKQTLTPDDIAIVFSAPNPINRGDIFVKETPRCPICTNDQQEEKSAEKANFFKRLFKF